MLEDEMFFANSSYFTTYVNTHIEDDRIETVTDMTVGK
jgi:hypothetical protein